MFRFRSLKTKFGGKKVVNLRILREDYYKIYPEQREEYLKEISDSEIKEFEKLITNQSEKEELKNKLPQISYRCIVHCS